jgi:hypothetical protein
MAGRRPIKRRKKKAPRPPQGQRRTRHVQVVTRVWLERLCPRRQPIRTDVTKVSFAGPARRATLE